ncbi:MAG: hypothetical protein ACSHYC_05920 [Alphaproteobacteria bacterium]
MDKRKLLETLAQRPSEELSDAPHSALPEEFLQKMRKFRSESAIEIEGNSGVSDEVLIDILRSTARQENEFSLENEFIDIRSEHE